MAKNIRTMKKQPRCEWLKQVECHRLQAAKSGPFGPFPAGQVRHMAQLLWDMPQKTAHFFRKASDRKRGKAGPSNPALQFNMENLPDKECVASGNGFASFIDWTLPGAPRTF